MAEPTIQLGGGKWAGKTDNLLGYYKEGERFYKQDFTFSRSTTGTYTDSDGYIQEMPYNKLLQSNDFDTTWGNYNSTETYDSNLNAWLIEKTGIYGFIRQFISLSGEQTLSVYAKASTLNWLHMKGSNNSAYFDLENGVLGSYNTTSASIESVGNGFYRCSITYSGDITDVRIYPADGNNDVSGTSGSIYIQNAQLVKGTSAKTYFPTTTRLNMPRVDYLNNSNGSLILEPQRTNLYLNSEPTANEGPAGNISYVGTSFGLGFNNYTYYLDNSVVRYRYGGTCAATTEYTLSVFVIMNDNSSPNVSASSTSGDFSIVIADGFATPISVTHYGNNIYRVIAKRTSGSSGLSNNGIAKYTGQSSVGFKAVGWQLEQGSYPTTLINTSGSSVTRNSDTLNLLNTSNIIGQSEGTLFFDANFNTADSYNISLSDSSSSNYISIDTTSGKAIFARVQSGGSTQATINTSAGYFEDGQRLKCAIAYKANDFAFYINGTQIGTDTSGSVPSTDDIRFARFNGSLAANQSVNEFKLYNTRLSNSELATLTTL